MSEKMDGRKRSIFAATMASIAAMFSIRGGPSTVRMGMSGAADRGSRETGFYHATRNGRRRWKKLRQSGLVSMRRRP